MRMKRFVLSACLLIVAISFATPALAQDVGVKAGFIWGQLRGDDGTPSTSYSSRRDWSAGIFTRFGAGPVVLQPEVLYSRRGATLALDGAPDLESRFRLDFLEVPVLLRLGGGSTSVYVGGYGAMKISARAESRPTDGEWTGVDISDQIETFDYGVLAGIAMDFGKFGLDGRYVLGMRRLFKSDEEGVEAPDLKHGGVAIYATLSF